MEGLPEISNHQFMEASIPLDLHVVLGSRSDIPLRLTRKYLRGFPVAVRFFVTSYVQGADDEKEETWMKATIQGEKGKGLQKSTSLILPVLGVLLLAVCGFFLLFLTRRTFIPADFDGSLEALQTMAAPSMPVLGLLMGLGLYLLGVRPRARALELVPALALGLLALLLSRAPLVYGIYPQDRSDFAKWIQPDAVSCTYGGLLLLCLIEGLCRPEGRRGFAWKGALWPLAASLLLLAAGFVQGWLVRWAMQSSMDVGTVERNKLVANLVCWALALAAALLAGWSCRGWNRRAAWMLAALGALGLVLYIYSRGFGGFSQQGVEQRNLAISYLYNSLLFGNGNMDALTLSLGWLSLGLWNLIPGRMSGRKGV